MARNRGNPLTWGIAAGASGLLVFALLPALPTSGAAPAASGVTHTVSIQGLADGVAPFSGSDGPGQDSGPINGRVRAGDELVVQARVVATSPDPIVIDVTGTGGLVAWDTMQPVGCTASSAGVQCSLGAFQTGDTIDVELTAHAAPRAAPGDVTGEIHVSSGGAAATRSFTVTAAAPALAATATAPRFIGTASRDGVDGVLVRYGVHIAGSRTTASVVASPPAQLSFPIELSGTGDGSSVVECSANGVADTAPAFSAAVSDLHPAADVDDTARVTAGGTWTCVTEGAHATVAVDGAGLGFGEFPTQTWDQSAVPEAEGVVSAGAVTVFVPLANLPAPATLSVGSVTGSNNGAGSSRTDEITSEQAGPTAARLSVYHGADPALAKPGSAVALQYVVTNTGNVPLSDVALTDANGVGNANHAEGSLAPGQSWTLDAMVVQHDSGLETTASASAATPDGAPVAATHTMTIALPPAPEAVHTTSAAVAAGTTSSTSSTSSTSNTSSTGGPGPVVAANAAPAGLADDKTTLTVYVGGIQFTALPGPVAVAGKQNLVEYEVKNKGATALTNVVVDDSTITNDATAIDCGVDTTTLNRIPSLAANDTVVCTRAFQPATTANVPFVASVTVAGVADASVNAGYQVKNAGLDLQFLVNGLDANTPPGPSVVANSLLTLTYRIANTGQVDLANVFVGHEDDEEGTFDGITCPPVGDDTDADATIDLLAAGQTVACTLTPRAASGQVTATATAAGTAASADGEDLVNEEGVIELTDTDTISYTGVGSGSGGTQPGSASTVPGTIGDGGTDSKSVMTGAAIVFVAGLALFIVARRRPRRAYQA